MRALAVALFAGVCATACLPVDDRPPPGILTVKLTSDDSLGPERKPFETDDGWTVSFDSFVMSVGYTRLGLSDACSDYAGSLFGPGRGYNRLIQLNAVEEQRISAIRLIGTCSLQFWNREPEDDSVLGEGVTKKLRDRLRKKKDDLFTKDFGTTLYVKGHAVRGEKRKTFTWSFRQAIRHRNCQVTTEAGVERGIQLESDETREYELHVLGKLLFLESPSSTKLAFEPFARADDEYGNADGRVTLSELHSTPLSAELSEWATKWVEEFDRTLEDVPRGVDVFTPETSDMKTYAGYVYLGLVPELVRFRRTGTCQVHQAFDRTMERVLRSQD